SVELSGEPFIVVGQVGHSTTAQVAVSVSAVGTMAYGGAGLQAGRLTWFGRDGIGVDAGLPEGNYTDFRLSRDQSRLAASLVNPKTAQPDICVTDSASGN